MTKEETNPEMSSTRAEVQISLEGVAMAQQMAKFAEFLQAEAGKQENNHSLGCQLDLHGRHPLGHPQDLLESCPLGLPWELPTGFLGKLCRKSLIDQDK